MVMHLEYISVGPWMTLRAAHPVELPTVVEMFCLHCPAKPSLGTRYLHMQNMASSTEKLIF